MRHLACTVGVAFLYQLVALPLYIFNGVGPDFVLAAVCAVAVFSRSAVALPTAFLCGVIVDFVSLDPWSAHSLGYLAAALILVRGPGSGRRRDVLSLLALVVSASVAATFVRHSILFIHYGGEDLPGSSRTVLEALYSSAITCLAVALLSPFRTALAGPRRHSEFNQPETAR